MNRLQDRLARLKPKRGSREPTIRSRLRLILALFAIGTALLALRLVDLQVIRADALADTAVQFRSRTYTLPAERGQILDANGQVLATSQERYNIAVNQNLVESYVRYGEDGEVTGQGVVAASEDLAPILGIEETRLAGLMLGGETKSSWVYIARDVSPETWRTINSFGIPGVEPESYMKREYPNGRLGSSVIGFLGEDDDGNYGGQSGIELTRDNVLSGEDGSLTVEISRSGAVIPSGRRIEQPAVHGGDVTLTIDADLEYALQTALDESVSAHGAKWGSAVAIEVGTGRVLALADTHTFDPSNPGAGGTIGSRAVQSPVEPGSTGKLVTFSAAFDQGTITPTDTFLSQTPMEMPNGEVIRDNDPHGAEEFTVAGTYAKSYNTGLVQIGDTISDETRYDYMLKYGLGSPTGIELPAESSGILHDPADWGPRGRYTTMFGQAYALTTVQLGQIIATIANDGVQVPLHIIDSVTHADGTVEPTVVGESERVISSETATTMMEVMQQVTMDGSTGWAARVDGYNVAGKTGTAQVPGPDGALNNRVGTFVGAIPAEDPQIAIAVVTYSTSGPGYGGEVAAPVFADFSAFAMRHMGVPPSTVPLVHYPWTATEMADARANDLLDEEGRFTE